MAIEWGSVADWVSGLGGLLSIAATGYIALHERNRSTQMEDRAEELEYVRRCAVIDEGVRLAEIAAERATSYIQLVSLGGGIHADSGFELKRDLIQVSNQINLLQAYPGNDPRLFVSLGGLSLACRLDDQQHDSNNSYLQSRCRTLVTLVDNAKSGLKSLK
ncbi:hypothetical protein E5554_16060 [Sphingobium sp. PAMC28499]|uniref:hypothetical protein n=1 Tax=Sphingobium sp. PAMC28499 TaxID=2565554 RepID=UPI00109E1764|nr:hypothetical protein [Sphingobium sp. PAMC28499]QCB39208.1 hypothetical protein E5554_16060 [Sphingobium sp. PAMC28499]|tara:strand:- start:264 stop:746 length:483 start_codon:yes stop_codon:yes gene_type:complete